MALSVLKPGESQANQDKWVTLDEGHGPSLQDTLWKSYNMFLLSHRPKLNHVAPFSCTGGRELAILFWWPYIPLNTYYKKRGGNRYWDQQAVPAGVPPSSQPAL